MPFLPRLLLCVIFLPILAVLLLAMNVVQMLSLALLPFSGRAFRYVNRTCAGLWFNCLIFFLEKGLRVEFVRTGDALPRGENAFMIANHQSGADIPALVAVAYPLGRTGDLK